MVGAVIEIEPVPVSETPLPLFHVPVLVPSLLVSTMVTPVPDSEADP